jgi:Na+-transporting NADH:ubiquinone oxidoreductase subunit E
VNWFIYGYLLGDGALTWLGFPDVNLSFLKPIVFIAVIAAMVQLVEMVIDKFSPSLYQSLVFFYH